MSLGETQACLARLYLSDAYRHWFYADSAAALASYRLDRDEREALAALSRDQLDRFAATLQAKRGKGPETAYPASYLLGEVGMRRLFARYHQLFHPRSDQSRVDDILAFGQFAEASLRDEPSAPPHAADLVRYERLFFAVSSVRAGPPDEPPRTESGELDPQAFPRTRAHVVLGRFEHDVAAAEDSLRRGAPCGADEVRGACTILFIPGRRDRGATMKRLNAATAVIVEQCTGRQRVHDVVGSAEARLGAPHLRKAVAAVLVQLTSAGALSFGLVPSDDATDYPAASDSEGI